ncbi:MAG: helix-turn-helix domain-containing protein [Nitrospiria bacterium]
MKEENNTERVGVYLRKIREQLGFSLQDIASKTKISLPYLENLENEDFSALPNDVFVKGFLRSYAKVLGLKELDILERFQHWKDAHETSSSPEHEKEEGQSRRSHWPRIQLERVRSFYENKRNLQRKILINMVIGIVVVMGAYVLFYKMKSAEDMGKEFNFPVVSSSPAPQPLSIAPATSAPSTVATGTPAEVTDNVPPRDQAKDQHLHLLVEAIDRSWMSIVIDDGITKEFSLHPGDKISLEAEKHFVLNIGNAGGVKLTLNGKPVGPFGKKGEIVRQIKLESR